MRKSCHEQNRKMLEAYEFYQRGQYNQSLAIYESIMEKTSNPQLRFNLICTVSVISAAIGNYNYALQILEHNIGDMKEVPTIAKIRCYSNLCFVYIVMGLYEQAIQSFRQIEEIIIGADNHSQALSFSFKLFFRVSCLEEIQKQIIIDKENNTLLQAFYLLNIAFAKDVCGFVGSQTLLKAAYPIFIMHKKMELAVICLRQLLLLPLSNKDILKYEKQIGKIMSLDLMEEYQLDNVQPIQCCKKIAEQLIVFARRLNLHNKDRSIIQNEHILWRIVLHYENRKLSNNGFVCEDEKTTIFKNIEMMMKQTNPLIIQQMKKIDFYLSAQRQIQAILAHLTKIIGNKIRNETKNVFSKLMAYSQYQQQKQSQKRSLTPLSIRRVEKENRIPSLFRDKSQGSKIGQLDKKQIHRLNQNQKQYPKTIYKMIKYCQYGSFLSKRNYNSDGGEYRFVRITKSILKWAKNPDKIEQSCQFYPLKDINSIHYGKCTPNLLKHSNQLLAQQFCFSLKLQKRTLDFYCKNFQQVSHWVCGLSFKLQQLNPKFHGYTFGKILWKRMFILFKEHFTSKIRKCDKKFYYEIAYAIILFGKNNYQLPIK